jgi:kynurenine 3-monooxygenase
MHGRMIHVRKQGQYVRQAQAYDARGRVGPSFFIQDVR